MKGIVLAGGTGSRLHPLTKITNKHLLPVFDKPMIYYPIQTLVDAGIQNIMVVTGGKNSGDFLRLLANGKLFGLKHIDYTYQEGEGGIADALALAEHFADGQKICVVLGDNIIERDIRQAADQFREQPGGAGILLDGYLPDSGNCSFRAFWKADAIAGGPISWLACLWRISAFAIVRGTTLQTVATNFNRSQVNTNLLLKEVPDAERFGVAELAGNRVINIEEKPKHPKSQYAVTGIYMYDSTVFEKIRMLVPSRRGELEITDVNNAYIREGTLSFSYLDGWWTDAGTFDSLLRAANLAAQSQREKAR